MIRCNYCSARHVINTIFCDECGQYLGEIDPRDTKLFETEIAPPVTLNPRDTLSMSSRRPSPTAESTRRPGGSLPVIRLRINATQRTVEHHLDHTILIGRLDPTNDIYPDIDLTAEDRLTRQISRRHARIFDRDHTAMIEDLGSFNHTFLNEEKLIPFGPTRLSAGDQLQLGSLKIEILDVTWNSKSTSIPIHRTGHRRPAPGQPGRLDQPVREFSRRQPLIIHN